ncbi:uncharacterized protein VDAG_02554 [Verticillium dahliae VdLs.17]|uniref:Amino acid transporter transmembrane domain-containing protein n=1 Tax=Verticillium dahliae (strain VdLs.17 / ATCC MYA-4575 / FGSC 10137) TaxID=498257 RepID=G2WY72_VERDV|nr:uncharacterized protein VDAG_02554 [Verticillium dahliae VdLs.17]EGY21030.1 hypothetical protein VDAG_02554 [Verticillium dahliae VdLs.17]
MSFACEGIIASNSNASNSSASGTSNIATISKTSSPSSSIATNASKFEASRSRCSGEERKLHRYSAAMASLKEGTVGNPDQKDTSELEKLGESYAVENPGEVFDQSEYRALGWIPAAVILLTLCFATGVLAIPATFSVLGYVPGLLVLLGFGALTTCIARCRSRNPFTRGKTNVLFKTMLISCGWRSVIVAWTLASGAGFVGLAQGFKALSSRNQASRPWEGLTIFTWIGFASLFTAVFIIVIGVTQVDRPAAAPQEGPFDIGVVTIGAPAVAPGLTAAVNIFAAFSSTPTFMPVIAEMKAPRAFKNSLFSSQIVLFICHVTMSLVVYLQDRQSGPRAASASPRQWCGQLVVRILRHSEHLQNRSFTHWDVWLYVFRDELGVRSFADMSDAGVPRSASAHSRSSAPGLSPSSATLSDCMAPSAWRQRVALLTPTRLAVLGLPLAAHDQGWDLGWLRCRRVRAESE